MGAEFHRSAGLPERVVYRSNERWNSNCPFGTDTCGGEGDERMVNCPRCGSQIPDGVRQCSNCGMGFLTPQETQEALATTAEYRILNLIFGISAFCMVLFPMAILLSLWPFTMNGWITIMVSLFYAVTVLTFCIITIRYTSWLKKKQFYNPEFINLSRAFFGNAAVTTGGFAIWSSVFAYNDDSQYWFNFVFIAVWSIIWLLALLIMMIRDEREAKRSLKVRT